MRTFGLLAGLLAGLFLGLMGAAQAQTISVPGSFSTIQEALDNANPGDTVKLGKGRFFENVAVAGPLNNITISLPCEVVSISTFL